MYYYTILFDAQAKATYQFITCGKLWKALKNALK